MPTAATRGEATQAALFLHYVLTSALWATCTAEQPVQGQDPHIWEGKCDCEEALDVTSAPQTERSTERKRPVAEASSTLWC